MCETWRTGYENGDDVIGDFNRLCHTLMRLGIVEVMFLEDHISRYYPPMEDMHWDETEEYHDVGVTIRVNGELTMHGVYSGWC